MVPPAITMSYRARGVLLQASGRSVPASNANVGTTVRRPGSVMGCDSSMLRGLQDLLEGKIFRGESDDETVLEVDAKLAVLRSVGPVDLVRVGERVDFVRLADLGLDGSRCQADQRWLRGLCRNGGQE